MTRPSLILNNCYLVPRGERPVLSRLAMPVAAEVGSAASAMFTLGSDGSVRVDLEGYAIVPLEEYGRHSRAVARMVRKGTKKPRRREAPGLP